MEGILIQLGYARVSTDGQSLDAQIEALEAAGCCKVFAEKISGVRSDRPQLAKALKVLGAGDVLVVSRLDRLARSTRDLLNVLAVVVERGAGFRSLSDSWAGTTTPHGRLMLTVLGGLAEFERELIKARTAEGRARARAQGVRFGRKPKLTPHQRQDPASRGRRGAGRHRPDLQRESLDDQPTLRAPCAQPTVRTPKPDDASLSLGSSFVRSRRSEGRVLIEHS